MDTVQLSLNVLDLGVNLYHLPFFT